MSDNTFKYQLCRMILVNIGTNLHVPSNRITQIDPRGGAAILGANGIGKTTTLRILPLFFGHLPSQIIAAGQGQDAMIRFLLPSDVSAIAFEYQRGSDDPDDLRLAVIRRRADDPDTPFYRLHRSGYRKELFVTNGRFLDDEETQGKATELGIPSTPKLTTAEYRAVILRTQATSKRRDSLRNLSLEYSFGPRRLDNLDRVVAAMVKKHINFGDIVQVAIGLVQNNLGQGAERAKLSLKQGRAPIEHWLRNREACAAAFALAPKFTELDDHLADHRAAEARLRTCRADVALLAAARTQEAKELAAALESMAVQWDEGQQRAKRQLGALIDAANLASTQLADSQSQLRELEGEAHHFEAEKASTWEHSILELPSLKAQAQTTQERIGLLENTQQNAALEYERRKNEARTTSDALLLDLERGKSEPQRRRDTSLQHIAKAESDARATYEGEFSRRQAELEDDMTALLGDQGIWDARSRNPAASDAAVHAATQSNTKRLEHADLVNQQQNVANKAVIELQTATHEFHQQEERLRGARTSLSQANDALAQARAHHDPAPGTLLAALRAHEDSRWKRNLAKAIHPGLLGREDLDPSLADELAETLYGWQINTGVLPTPDWADDPLARQAVDDAQARVDAAAQRVMEEEASLVRWGKARTDAEFKAQTTAARQLQLTEQTQTIRQQHETALAAVEKERRDAAAHARSELSRIKGLRDDLTSQKQRLIIEKRDALASIASSHADQRRDAETLYKQTIDAIDTQASRLRDELTQTLKAFDAQLAEHLSEQGVDVNQLSRLRDEASKLWVAIRAREDRVILVERWQAWVESGGPTKLAALKGTTEAQAKRAAEAAADVTNFKRQMEASANAYAAATEAKVKRKQAVEDELQVLTSLDEEFGDYQAIGGSVIDPSTPAASIRKKVHDARAKLRTLENEIHQRTTSLRQALTAKPSSVQVFVDATLDKQPADQDIARATALSICYRQIGSQVATDVNLTLKTLLVNIGAFHKSIKAFEREVSLFNQRLQEGLSEVRCFERLKDMRLDIVTNFEGLGFYKKLAAMDEVVRRHALEGGQRFNTALPPDETARALGDFMGVLGADGNVEVNLSSYITVKGSVTDNGMRKEFKRASELENVSSEGLTSLVLITLMTALLNTIRGPDPVQIPWVTDEVGKYDPINFRALIERLRDNRIDVLTASPELGPAQHAMFAHRYLFKDQGRITAYQMPEAPVDDPIRSRALEALS